MDVSSVVGAPWRCGVLLTWSGIAGIRLGHLLGREDDSTPQSGVEAPRLLKRSLSRLYLCCCCLVVCAVVFCLFALQDMIMQRVIFRSLPVYPVLNSSHFIWTTLNWVSCFLVFP